MTDYLTLGFMYFKNSIVLAIIVYAVHIAISAIRHKIDFKNISSLPKAKMAAEFLLLVYVFTILRVTGIIGMELYPDISFRSITYLVSVPFVGSSIQMITLNLMLFIPYGFLVPLAFPSCKLNWKKMLAIVFLSSLFIEITQIFSGRLCEIDDLIANTSGFMVGFLIVQSLQKILTKESMKKGIIQIIATVAITSIVLFFLSFIANGDAIQQQIDAFYNEIGNDEALSSISEFRIYKNSKTVDILNEHSEDFELYYIQIGIDIGNVASYYQIQKNNTDIETIFDKSDDMTYIEVIFDKKQVFRFYNNQEWEMKDISHMVYCVEDGTLWYGSKQDSLNYCAQYVSMEYPFSIDEELMNQALDWLGI